MSERRVLLVDDDPEILEVLSLVLRETACTVRTATDGHAALAVLAEGFVPCLIILDLMMPGMDGWTFREKQLADPMCASIPVVVFTGDPLALRRPPPRGVEHCWRKPVDLDTLLGGVTHFCG
jgi:CheY-like chemotaxis protein